MVLKYAIKTNLIKEVKYLKNKILSKEDELIKIVADKKIDKFLKQSKINEIKLQLLRWRRRIITISKKLDFMRGE